MYLSLSNLSRVMLHRSCFCVFMLMLSMSINTELLARGGGGRSGGGSVSRGGGGASASRSPSMSRPSPSASRPSPSASRPSPSASRPSPSASRPSPSASRPSTSPSRPTASPSRPDPSTTRPKFAQRGNSSFGSRWWFTWWRNLAAKSRCRKGGFRESSITEPVARLSRYSLQRCKSPCGGNPSG